MVLCFYGNCVGVCEHIMSLHLCVFHVFFFNFFILFVLSYSVFNFILFSTIIILDACLSSNASLKKGCGFAWLGK